MLQTVYQKTSKSSLFKQNFASGLVVFLVPLLQVLHRFRALFQALLAVLLSAG